MMRGDWGEPSFGTFGHDIGGTGIVGMVLMIILWIAVIAAIVIAIRALVIHSHHKSAAAGYPVTGPAPTAPSVGPGPTTDRTALLAILEQRYAKGEVTREDFLQRKADLGFGEPPATS